MSAETLAISALGASAAGTVVSTLGAIQQGKAAQAEANYRSQVARNNAILANRAAEDARKQGELEANLQRQESRQLQARQRAALAGAGVVVDQDSAATLVEDTAALGELDALTIRNNAEREALGFEAQAGNFNADAELASLEGRNARRAATFKAGATLITGFGSVASKWSGFKHEKIL